MTDGWWESGEVCCPVAGAECCCVWGGKDVTDGMGWNGFCGRSGEYEAMLFVEEWVGVTPDVGAVG